MKFSKQIIDMLKPIKNIFRSDIFITVALLLLSYFSYTVNNKYKERFTQDERKNLLDNIKVQNDLFKSVFNKISNNDVTISKNLITNKNATISGPLQVNNTIKTNSKDISNGKITLGGNGTIYTDRLNVKSIENNPKCRDVYGSYQEGAGKNMEYMDRQSISCHQHEFINFFKWERSGNNLRIKARCCSYK